MLHSTVYCVLSWDDLAKNWRIIVFKSQYVYLINAFTERERCNVSIHIHQRPWKNVRKKSMRIDCGVRKKKKNWKLTYTYGAYSRRHSHLRRIRRRPRRSNGHWRWLWHDWRHAGSGHLWSQKPRRYRSPLKIKKKKKMSINSTFRKWRRYVHRFSTTNKADYH